jgi:DNA-binding beta-propeller fold protein YncE
MHVRRLIPLLVFVSLSLVTAAHAQPGGRLYWIDTNFGAPTLNKADVFGGLISSVALPSGSQPEGIAIDAVGKVYWTEGAWSGARVQWANPTLSYTATLISGGSALRGIAVDDIDQYLFWTSSHLGPSASIQRSTLNGTGVTTIVSLPPGANPRGIAYDKAGKLYWADYDLDRIYRANLDGSLVEVWQTLAPGAHPWGVVFNMSDQSIYWTEYGSGRIQRAATLSGFPIVLLSGIPGPTYIAIDALGGNMYWADATFGSQHIERALLSGGARVVLPPALQTYGGLAFQGNALLSAPPASLPTEFALASPMPNPSRGAVQVEFALPRDARVRVSVIDLQGREVALLADGVLPAGRHSRSWSDDAPHRAAAGIYFVRLAADGRTWVQRIVRIR